VGQHHGGGHAADEEDKRTATSVVTNALNAGPVLEVTDVQREEEKQARLHQAPAKNPPHATKEKQHKQPVKQPIVQPTRGI